MLSIRDLISGALEFNNNTLVELKNIVEQYPYYQTARLLYIANLYHQHDERLSDELKKASVYVPDRCALFMMIEGMHHSIDRVTSEVKGIESSNSVSHTVSLIDNFLHSSKRRNNEQATTRHLPTIADLTTDYAAFLVQQEDGPEEDDNVPKLRGSNLIDNFIEATKGHQIISLHEVDDEEQEFVSPVISDEAEEIYTENMVNVYIRQGRYEQALEILRKIILNNPEKNHNFATQIKLLEVILES